MDKAIRVMGIDPGLRRTGWGVLEAHGSSLRFIAAGTVRSCEKSTLSFRLRQLHDGLHKAIALYKPDEAAVEITFVNRDACATLKLGQARGVAMLVPALCEIPVSEYAPNTVKKAIVGVGHAHKSQIVTMIKMLLPKAVFDGEDAADALAVGVCHVHHRSALLSCNRLIS